LKRKPSNKNEGENKLILHQQMIEPTETITMTRVCLEIIFIKIIFKGSFIAWRTSRTLYLVCRCGRRNSFGNY